MSTSTVVTLDDLEHTEDGHLSYPQLDNEHDPMEEVPVDNVRQVLKDRLFVGNLAPTVDESTLIKVFSRFGRVTKVDMPIHKTGLSKGKPKGYAFIEYGHKDDALKALTMAHEKLLRGRNITVKFAHQAPLDQYSGSGLPSTLKNRKTMMETGRPTSLSMIKAAGSGRHEIKTGDKIAMMEAKLRQMESTNPKPSIPSSSLEDASAMGSPLTPSVSPSLPYHSSLPPKPPKPLPPHLNVQHPSPLAAPRPKTPLPSLPLLPQSRSSGTPPLGRSSPCLASGLATHAHPPKAKLIGVKIKPKEKDPGKR
ncbi:hypothetical protein NLJ89_g4662 [Agrocybe chaxingu]|uniref:RRM domain-containing protein n=1 Tax=Agrocybe chaxingu TaxID=84603 RepID=A0A9W8MWB2_9AGAR|nr:hypothetical protein NLJ89_g4662 [Agrocybe chaxingu]